MDIKKYLYCFIFPALFSGLIAVPVTFYMTVNYEKERVVAEYKLDTFKGVAGYRYIFNKPNSSGNDKFVSSMNQVPFAFGDSPLVIEKHEEYYKIRSNKSFGAQANNDAFIKLVYAMMDDLEIPRKSIGDNTLEKVFTIGN
ncbi:DUF6680 family protein [Shewanella sp. KT0246]|uniref:DUF6680 family protein n=1 Tax=Shewanella sp. KT0246 TaxID=2815912 RepID=UPI001BC43CC1|nr:DUF6680 family protein [Shewanella sp. KT0246]GIU02580.1 hypothetical protein TUM4249_39490 [Shewanella sp. KT0246]